MPNAYISGTGYYVPPRRVTNDELVTEYRIDTSNEWIVQRTGIEERRFADAGVSCSDLALKASEMAIRNAGIDKKAIEMIIFATLSPDQHFPGSGCFLQEKLGLCDGDSATFVPALDIRNQCSGFLYGLATADSMIKSGAVKHVLLVGAEVHSAAIDLTTRGRNVSTLFGDGAGVVVVSATDADRGVRRWNLGADGRNADKLHMRIWDISKRPYIPLDESGNGCMLPEMMYPNMNGKAVFKHAVERMISVLLKTLGDVNQSLNDVDLFLFHQANLRINQFIQQQLGVPEEKFFHNIQRYGNTTAGTIPILLAEAEENGRLKPGMKVAIVVFGSGFTWGCALIDW
ncbi:MAG: ketoacyl-ACP synthase III [Deltaproteobacteria bacterium]|nr:ketoacyl-ACP synthase III [Deltaproteobacteria bacterium]